MSIADSPVPITTLLTHRPWVRRLARSLVHDEASADDVEQRTWVVALQKPPREAGAVRSWLARVVRSQALNAHRATSRRAAHERTGARPEALPPTQRIVAAAEIHKRLVVAVLDLAEPYRSTVLLRFFEDLPPREVARRMSVPVETVRTRLRRALETLRERLGAHGDTDAWKAAIVPLLTLRAGPGAAVGSGMAATAAGGTLMAAKATVLAGAGLVLTAGFVGGSFLVGEGDRAAPAGVLAQPDAAAERSAPETLAVDSSRDGARAARREQLAADDAARKPTATDAATASTAQLLVEARSLTKHAGTTQAIADAEAALGACAIVLAQELDPDQRAEALILQASAHQVLGDDAACDASLREATELAGSSRATGRDAAQEFARVAMVRGDLRTAAERYLAAAVRPGALASERAYLRLQAAHALGGAHDFARARAQYASVVDEFGAAVDPGVRRWADMARSSLAKLDEDRRGR
jgi:RNA polymerase sigma factor (sigma-70 family)